MESKERRVRCAVIADIQYADQEDSDTRHYRASLAKLESIINMIEENQVDFVLQLGDLIDRGIANFEPVLRCLQKLSVPVFHVLGNHDFAVGVEYIHHVGPRLGLSCPYYDFSFGSWRFVVLDGTDVSIFANDTGTESHDSAVSILGTLKQEGRENANPWNGGIGDHQISWLTGILDKSRANGEHVAIACHFPLETDDNRHTLLNSRQILQIVGQYDHIALYLAGHDHRGHYARKELTHFVTVKGIVENDDTPWSIFSFGEFNIEISGFETEPSRSLPLRTL
jgi:manganese-dependent ADP-ribose/CDP-alcohol diphosphatase